MESAFKLLKTLVEETSMEALSGPQKEILKFQVEQVYLLQRIGTITPVCPFQGVAQPDSIGNRVQAGQGEHGGRWGPELLPLRP